jgi:hypothetical protein
MNTLFLLLGRYDGRHALTVDEFARDFLSVTPKTARNLRAQQRFPVPVLPNGQIDLRDVAQWWDEQRKAANAA